MGTRIGVCAIQGDFERHLQMLSKNPYAEGIEVRVPADLERVDRLILPGGESTTVGMLMQRFGLAEAIQLRAKSGMPIWGTCMGLILLAKSIENMENQYSLQLLDIQVKRNAFGAQVHSFTSNVFFAPLNREVEATFIRAPVVTQQGDNVSTVSRIDDKVVAVQQGNILGTSYHPELGNDPSVHEYFLNL